MSKESSSSITNLLIFVCLLALIAGGAWIFLKTQAPKAPKKGNDFTQDLLVEVEKLEKIWREGDIEGQIAAGKLDCPNLPKEKVHSSYYQCNPLYLLCKIKHGALESFDLTGKSYDRRGRLQVSLKHIKSGKLAGARFHDDCGKIKLPASVYSAGPQEGQKYLWDNFGQSVLIDARYATEGEVHVWRKEKGEKETLAFHKPAVELSLEEKKEFCQSKGGQLAPSRIFDAAVFLPAKGENGYVYKFPYPWTRNNEALKGIEKDCEKIFSKECSQKKYEYHSTYSPSWSGVFHALGSYVEVFDNKFMPEADLKLSSMLLPLNSPWHRLGLRASSSGADLIEYNGVGLDNPMMLKDIRSAFRCVYYQ